MAHEPRTDNSKVIEELEAENKRLRGALEDITFKSDHEDCWDIAYEAIKGE